MIQKLINKTIQDVEFDTGQRFGFNQERDVAISALIFTDGSRLEIEAIMAGDNDSEPFARIRFIEPK